jgi:hypothetical protein
MFAEAPQCRVLVRFADGLDGSKVINHSGVKPQISSLYDGGSILGAFQGPSPRDDFITLGKRYIHAIYEEPPKTFLLCMNAPIDLP